MTLFPVPEDRETDRVYHIELENEDYVCEVIGDAEQQWLAVAIPVEHVEKALKQYREYMEERVLDDTYNLIWLYALVKE